ncbi:hypothetical protein [Streptomyces phaeochromogenes]|uniref:hypothetical protein n=1 Tax=Streptomyces phaeochromogenes TaxID=1923 RepID=UPI00368050B6
MGLRSSGTRTGWGREAGTGVPYGARPARLSSHRAGPARRDRTAVELRGMRRQFGRGASAAHALRDSFTAETRPSGGAGPSGSAGPAGEPAGASAAPRSAPVIVILGPTTATVPARAGIRGTLDA